MVSAETDFGQLLAVSGATTQSFVLLRREIDRRSASQAALFGLTAASGQGRPLTLGTCAPKVKLQIPLAPGGTVVEPSCCSERPAPRKMLDPTMDAPDAGAAPSRKCQRGSPVSASYATAETFVVHDAMTTPLV